MTLHRAILEGAAQIAVPALVSTLCICVVFLPMFFLSGVARYLFLPLAEAVVFAMLASYVLSRTLVPTMAMYLLRAKHRTAVASRNPLVMAQWLFERGFDRIRDAYSALLATLLDHRRVFVPVFLVACLSAFLLYAWLGQDFFPARTPGSSNCTSGPRPAPASRKPRGSATLWSIYPAPYSRNELVSVLDNIGVPYSSINTIYSNSAPIGAADADVLVSLSKTIAPPKSMCGPFGLRCRANSLAPRFTSCPTISSARF